MSKANQRYTKFPASALGGRAEELRGSLLFGKIEEVESEELWRQETNIGLIVCCVRNPGGVNYPAATDDIELCISTFEAKMTEKRVSMRLGQPCGHVWSVDKMC